jgi:hypothetical protein
MTDQHIKEVLLAYTTLLTSTTGSFNNLEKFQGIRHLGGTLLSACQGGAAGMHHPAHQHHR